MCLTSTLFANKFNVKHHCLMDFGLLKSGFWTMNPYFPMMELTSVALLIEVEKRAIGKK